MDVGIDLNQLQDLISQILNAIFGQNVPKWLEDGVFLLILLGILATAINGLLQILDKIIDWIQRIKPLFYNEEKKRFSSSRQSFARHLYNELVHINLREDWEDLEFAELEAEVYITGKWLPNNKLLRWLRHNRSYEEAHLESSLTRALQISQERRILLEGEPGSGKSVALRHVALEMLNKLKHSSDITNPIPVYINLKELKPYQNERIDRALIERFVIEVLTRINDRNVDHFVNDNFQSGLEKGDWFFLFDSFDEIPDLLSSTDSDTVIRQYSRALDDFLAGMNQCRGIVASRTYHGPRYLSWSRFTIVSLTLDRMEQLINKSSLNASTKRRLFNHLKRSDQDMRESTSNPLFLRLLCNYMESHEQIPKSPVIVYQEYVSKRLKQDRQRVEDKFTIEISELQKYAEHIAFVMMFDDQLGLIATRNSIIQGLDKFGFQHALNIDAYFDALEFIKLGRGEEKIEGKYFSFSHRRFQEYFATHIIIKYPDIIPSEVLFTDARWRESVVVILQTASLETVNQLFKVVGILLDRYVDRLDLDELEKPLATLKDNQYSDKEQLTPKTEFPWPEQSTHILSILQEGLSARSSILPEVIQLKISIVLLSAMRTGILPDRMIAARYLSLVTDSVATLLTESAFAERNYSLAQIVFSQSRKIKILQGTILEQDIVRWYLRSFLDNNLLFNFDEYLLNSRRYDGKIDFKRLISQIFSINIWDFIILHFLLVVLLVRIYNSVSLLPYLLISLTIGILLLYKNPQSHVIYNSFHTGMFGLWFPSHERNKLGFTSGLLGSLVFIFILRSLFRANNVLESVILFLLAIYYYVWKDLAIASIYKTREPLMKGISIPFFGIHLTIWGEFVQTLKDSNFRTRLRFFYELLILNVKHIISDTEALFKNVALISIVFGMWLLGLNNPSSPLQLLSTYVLIIIAIISIIIYVRAGNRKSKKWDKLSKELHVDSIEISDWILKSKEAVTLERYLSFLQITLSEGILEKNYQNYELLSDLIVLIENNFTQVEEFREKWGRIISELDTLINLMQDRPFLARSNIVEKLDQIRKKIKVTTDDSSQMPPH